MHFSEIGLRRKKEQHEDVEPVHALMNNKVSVRMPTHHRLSRI